VSIKQSGEAFSEKQVFSLKNPIKKPRRFGRGLVFSKITGYLPWPPGVKQSSILPPPARPICNYERPARKAVHYSDPSLWNSEFGIRLKNYHSVFGRVIPERGGKGVDGDVP